MRWNSRTWKGRNTHKTYTQINYTREIHSICKYLFFFSSLIELQQLAFGSHERCIMNRGKSACFCESFTLNRSKFCVDFFLSTLQKCKHNQQLHFWWEFTRIFRLSKFKVEKTKHENELNWFSLDVEYYNVFLSIYMRSDWRMKFHMHISRQTAESKMFNWNEKKNRMKNGNYKQKQLKIRIEFEQLVLTNKQKHWGITVVAIDNRSI